MKSSVYAILLTLAAMTNALAQTTTYVYVGNSNSNSVSTFKLNGEASAPSLSFIGDIKLDEHGLSGVSTPMAYSTKRKMLFVASRHKKSALTRFMVAPTSGELSFVNSTPLQYSHAYIALSNDEDMLIAASYPQNLVQSIVVKANGVPATQHTFSDFPSAHAVAFSHSGQHIFVPSLGNDRVNLLSLSDNEVSILDGQYIQFPDGSGPRHLVIHPQNNVMYVLGELNAILYTLHLNNDTKQYEITQSTPLIDIEIPTDFKAADVKITANGKYLFATERSTNSLCSFEVLTSTQFVRKIACIQTEDWPRGIQIDNKNGLLLAAGQKSHHMSLYAIEKNGELRFIERYKTGEGPNWIEVVNF